MKRFSKVLIVLCLCVSVGLVLFGCGEAKITSASIKAGTIETTIAKDAVLDTSQAIAIIKYSDDKTIEVGADQLTFSEIDSSVANTTQILKVTYKDFSFNVSIRIVATEADVSSIISMYSRLVTEFTLNKEATGINDGFRDITDSLYVGQDNSFDFRINASGIDGAGKLVENLTKVRTNITVELKGEFPPEGYRTLEGTDLTDMVIVDSENSTFNFTTKAVGEEFRITVAAANRDEDYAESATKFTENVVVVEGYNVYDAKNLSVYDNSNTAWDGLKNEWGIDTVTTDSVILQGDISVTRSDVPDSFFWKTTDAGFAAQNGRTNQTLEGSLIDDSGSAIYTRKINNGETFNFIGNYFGVSFKDFPKMVVEAGNDLDRPIVNTDTSDDKKASYMTAHTCAFRTEALDENSIDSATKVNWKNISFFGNGALNADPVNSGAILLMKNRAINFEAYNTITNNFYIGYFFEQGEADNSFVGKYVVDNCKGYNSYNCLFYFWGAKEVIIKNSEFKHAGGPVMIVDHVDHNTDGTGGVS